LVPLEYNYCRERRREVKKWYRIEMKGDNADIYIYDEIGYWGVNAQDFATSLALVKDFKTINLYINSPGGDVFEGMAIYNALLTVKEKLTAHVMGLAASMASVILMAAPKRIIHQGAMVMVHNPSGGAWGTSEDMRKVAATLDQIKMQMVNLYVNTTGLPEEDVKKLMDNETWLTAQDSVDKGFATEKSESKEVASIKKKYVAKFHNLPEGVVVVDEPTVREAEDALRDVGFSDSRAKLILSKGYRRDGDNPDRDGEEDFSEALGIINQMKIKLEAI
jgi:ATP-dependent Clp endopeptidase proteolytic subunit ClpP